jgi:ABC-2 type transport system ATP-binding protein
MIRVSGFHKSYRDTEAVRDLCFEVQPGEIMGLVGPNGAGKTTTLRSIAGIIPPTGGQLEVAGHDIVTDSVAAKYQLAYVPDDPKLFDQLSVWEHLEFAASAYRVGDWSERGARLLEQFELEEKRNTLAQELSRGMRQKVAICCAYLHDPRVMLFDEPHTGLDPRGIRTMKDSIMERAKAGAAVIISSHLLVLVEDLCTHLLILHKGQRLFFGRIGDARAAFDDMEGDASLEEVFFRATEGGRAAQASVRPDS